MWFWLINCFVIDENFFVYFLQVYDLLFLYLVKEICNGKEWFYNYIKFVMDGYVFVEFWVFLQIKEKSF